MYLDDLYLSRHREVTLLSLLQKTYYDCLNQPFSFYLTIQCVISALNNLNKTNHQHHPTLL